MRLPEAIRLIIVTRAGSISPVLFVEIFAALGAVALIITISTTIAVTVLGAGLIIVVLVACSVLHFTNVVRFNTLPESGRIMGGILP
jgi:hypothetical protein